jgi:hypothetical protein
MEYSKDYFDRLLKYPLNEEERLDYRTFMDQLVCNKFNEEEQVYIVSKDPYLISKLFYATSRVREAAIKKDPNVIRDMYNITNDIKWFAISNGCLLKYIEDPTLEMKEEAIKRNSDNIIYIDNPSDKLLDIAISHSVIPKNRADLDFYPGQFSYIQSKEFFKFLEDKKTMLKTLKDREVYLLQKQEKLNKNQGKCTIS